MQNNRLTILAINPGTRYIGIAVLKGSVLIDWSIKVISGKISPPKRKLMAKLIYQLIYEHKPDIIVMKKLHCSRSSCSLDQLCRDVENITATEDIRLMQYSIEEVEQFFAPEKRINKTTLAELICKKHPVLIHDLKREQDNLNVYYIRMFEAVALGTMALSKSDLSIL